MHSQKGLFGFVCSVLLLTLLSCFPTQAEKLPLRYSSYTCFQDGETRRVALLRKTEGNIDLKKLSRLSRAATKRARDRIGELKREVRSSQASQAQRKKRKKLRASIRQLRLLQDIGEDCANGVIRSADGRVSLTIPDDVLYRGNEQVAFRIEIASRPHPESLTKSYRIAPKGIVFAPAATLSLLPPQKLWRALRQEDVVLGLVNHDSTLRLETERDMEKMELRASLPVSGTVALLDLQAPLSDTEVHQSLAETLFPLLPVRNIGMTRDGIQLQPGDVVAEPSPSFTRSSSAPRSVSIKSASSLFYIDLAPGAAFQHPGIFVLQNQESGTFRFLHSLWWPEVNGEAELDRPQLRHKGGGATAGKDLEPVRPTGRKPFTEEEQLFFETFPSMEEAHDAEACNNVCEGTQVLVLSASKDLFGFDQNRKALADHFRTASFAHQPVTVRDWDPRTALEFRQELEKLKKSEGCWCEVVIYVTSHGFEGGIAVQPDSQTELESKEVTYVFWGDMLKVLKEVCSKKTTLILDSCRAGGIIEEIESRRRGMIPRLKRIKEAKERGENTDLQELTLRNDFGEYLCADFDVVYSADERRYNYFYTEEEYLGGDVVKPGLFMRALLEQLGDDGSDVRSAGDGVKKYYDSIGDGPYAAHPGRETVKRVPGNWQCCERCCCVEEHDGAGEGAVDPTEESSHGCFERLNGRELRAGPSISSCGFGALDVLDGGESTAEVAMEIGEIPVMSFTLGQSDQFSADAPLYAPANLLYPWSCEMSCVFSGEVDEVHFRCVTETEGQEVLECRDTYLPL